VKRGERIWTCEVCGKEAPWGDGWQSYGSIRNDEGGLPPIVVCSLACRDDQKTKQLIEEYCVVEAAMKKEGYFRRGPCR